VACLSSHGLMGHLTGEAAGYVHKSVTQVVTALARHPEWSEPPSTPSSRVERACERNRGISVRDTAAEIPPPHNGVPPLRRIPTALRSFLAEFTLSLPKGSG
jgi:hypothetical protein